MASKKRSSPPASIPSKSVRQRQDGKQSRAEKKAMNSEILTQVSKQVNRDVHTEIALRSVVPIGPPLERSTKSGRPYIYTEKLGQTFFELVSTGHSLDRIAEREDMPSLGTILAWIDIENHAFHKFYVTGKKALVPLFEERMALAGLEVEPLTITIHRKGTTATGPIDVIEEKTVDNTARSQLRMNAYQLTLAHLLPRKHGRTPDLGNSGQNAQLEGLFASLKSGPADE